MLRSNSKKRTKLRAGARQEALVTRKSRKGLADLKAVLVAGAGKLDQEKLGVLTEALEGSLACPLSSCVVTDPIVIRRRLVEYLRATGAPSGKIQFLEQLFMGVVRRASLKGLIPPPPEGPWTRAWQSVLDHASPGTKAVLRTLAAWATSRGLDPPNLKTAHLELWARHLSLDSRSVIRARQALAYPPSVLSHLPPLSDNVRETRLRRKAMYGSVSPNLHKQFT